MAAPFKKFVIHAGDANTFHIYVSGKKVIHDASHEENNRVSTERRAFIESAIWEKLERERSQR